MTDQPEPERGLFDWVNTRVDGHPVRFWILFAMVIASGVIGFGARWTTRRRPSSPRYPTLLSPR